MTTKELDRQYIAPTYGRFPVEIVSGKGSLVTDDEGREYIDMGTGIAVNTFGLSDPEWIAAVTAQLGKFQHTSNLYYAAPCAELAEMLCPAAGMKKVFFGNSGAEANECAIKAARKYAQDKKGAEYYNIITLKNSFHGRTLTTLAATGQDVFHELFQPLTPGFVTVPVDLAAIEAQVSKGSVAGILFEPVLGEGGVLDLPRDFVQGLRAICDREDIVLMCDEVQTGNGRTGRLYGYMNFDIVPDVVSTAKGLGGGHRQGNAAGLHGQDQLRRVRPESLGKGLPHGSHQRRVDAVVQKAVYLHNIRPESSAFPLDGLLQLLHDFTLPFLSFPVSFYPNFRAYARRT
mgnify:CR=1 FL=1